MKKTVYLGTVSGNPYISLRVEDFDKSNVGEILNEIESYGGIIKWIEIGTIDGEIVLSSGSSAERAKTLSKLMVKILDAGWELAKPHEPLSIQPK